MLKILSGELVKKLDATHLEVSGISSLELMERAASSFLSWWQSQGFDSDLPVYVFCGAGNNGGDGLAIARILQATGVTVTVFKCFHQSATLSPDTFANLSRLPGEIQVESWKDFDLSSKGILVDAFLGVGLKGELRDEAREVIATINRFQGRRISVDIPSGLPSDDMLEGVVVKADYTVTFAFPKLSLLFPEHAPFTGQLSITDIGIGDEEYAAFPGNFFFLRQKDVPAFHRKFHRFSHKSDFGRVLVYGGSKGKMGASILATKAALRTGSGLVTALIPESERGIMQALVPEAMCRFDLAGDDLGKFDAIGIGPGIGLEGTAADLEYLFRNYSNPIVLDADALTLLGQNPDLIPLIPKGSILTPHLAEFDRLLGKSENHMQRLAKASDFCQNYGLQLLIKGANSVICLADGRQIFNSSGTQYMATGGSGDVLTGMLTSFLGQGYSPEQALICGVFHHGLAGEIAGEEKRRGTLATDIVEAIPDTFILLDIS